ncbi:MAG: 3-keto-disaccharide hydrolase [Actinomycetota bacterium]
MSTTTRREALAALVGLTFVSLPVAAAAETAKGEEKGWKPLFDGESLAGWKRTEFAGGGEVRVEKSFKGGPAAIVVDAGENLSGFNWTKEAPKMNYEITLEALKIQGNDFMCGLTFPVGDSHASLILGGWGGVVTGISSIDGSDASENQTTRQLDFFKDRWYKVRLRVTPDKLEAWLDEKQIVDQEIKGHKISLRPGSISLSTPIGICTYQTSAAYRNIKLRTLKK